MKVGAKEAGREGGEEGGRGGRRECKRCNIFFVVTPTELSFYASRRYVFFFCVTEAELSFVVSRESARSVVYGDENRLTYCDILCLSQALYICFMSERAYTQSS